MRRFLGLFFLTSLLIALVQHIPYSNPSQSRALAHTEPAYQTPDLLYDEARTVYLGNLTTWEILPDALRVFRRCAGTAS